MKKFPLYYVLIAIIIGGTYENAIGWGFRSHRNIHAAAINGLPAELAPFFEKHREFIIEESVAPDLRRSDDPLEGPNHYINFDRYSEYPFPDFPLQYEEAVRRYGEETVRSYGLALWRIEEWFNRLTGAMQNQDVDSILFYAADIGHYIADIHMPLHNTLNFDGQLTDQRGIHRRFETDLPRLFDSEYSWEIPPARYIEDPLKKAFEIGVGAYALIDRLYEADREAVRGIPEDELYRIEQRNGRRIFIYHDRYYHQFHEALDGMVEQQLREAARMVRDYWYSAWIKAGKPDLPV